MMSYLTIHTIVFLQLAYAIWMGRWNPRQDKEPSKKEEVAFKEFLIAKYERKQWYRSPSEVRRENEKESSTPKTEPKLLPPPTTASKVIKCFQLCVFWHLSKMMGMC